MEETESAVLPVEAVTEWYALVFQEDDGYFGEVCDGSEEVCPPRRAFGAVSVGQLSQQQAERLFKKINEKQIVDDISGCPDIQLIPEKTIRLMSKDDQTSFGLLLDKKKPDYFATRDEAEDYMRAQWVLNTSVSVAALIRKTDGYKNDDKKKPVKMSASPVSPPCPSKATTDDKQPNSSSNRKRDRRLYDLSLNSKLTWAEIAKSVNDEFTSEQLDSRSAPVAAKRFWEKYHEEESLQPIPQRNPGRKPKKQSE